MSAVWIYMKERFPLPLVLLLSLGYTLLIVGVNTVPSAASLAASLCILISFTAFLLRLRVTDEFKDAEHDATNYPNRPVQRGAITKRSIIYLGILAGVVEIAAVVIAGFIMSHPFSAFWYLLVIGYSYLTAVEFFCPAWLTKHFTLYFISHQLIFICFALWAYFLFAASITPTYIGSVLAFFLLMSSVEIIRKYELRRDPNGRIVKDTYPAVWGKMNTLLILASFVLLSGILLALASWSVIPVLIAGLGLGLLWVVRRKTTAVQGVVAVVFIAQGLGAFIS